MVEVGSTVGGYRVLQALGGGPFGRVHLATAPSGHTVALKILKPSFLARRDGAGAVERLEASILAHTRLAHPGLARVLHPLADRERGVFGQVSEYVSGRPLAAGIVAPGVGRGDDLVGLAEVLGWFEQLGELLAWLHGQGMVHGNLKPKNVLLLETEGGCVVKLLDLSWSAIGVAAVAPGPEAFVSPEQYSGVVPTPASDQWALATMLERLLTGGKRRIALGVLPGALVQSIHRATHDEPSARFPTVAALTEALAEIRKELRRSTGQPVTGGSAEQGTLPGGRIPSDLSAGAGWGARARAPTSSGLGGPIPYPSFEEDGAEDPTIPGDSPFARGYGPRALEERETGDIAPPDVAETVRMPPVQRTDPVPTTQPPPVSVSDTSSEDDAETPMRRHSLGGVFGSFETEEEAPPPPPRPSPMASGGPSPAATVPNLPPVAWGPPKSDLSGIDPASLTPPYPGTPSPFASPLTRDVPIGAPPAMAAETSDAGPAPARSDTPPPPPLAPSPRGAPALAVAALLVGALLTGAWTLLASEGGRALLEQAGVPVEALGVATSTSAR